jgi:hypothetical protein
MRIIGLVGVLALTLASMGSASADVLFDNGTFSGTQEGRNASDGLAVIEDFELSSDATITGFEWTQHDNLNVPYNFTELSIYRDAPILANLIFTITTPANRTPNGTPIIFQNLHGFDYSISNLSIDVTAGTYFFSIRSEFPTGGATWDMTTGTDSTIQGRWQYRIDGGGEPFPGVFWGQENSAFRIVSNLIIVGIDINNRINLCASGPIPVAILSSETFDAPAEVDPITVSLEGAGVKTVGEDDRPLPPQTRDVNGDGLADLIFKIAREGLGLGTFGGMPIEGTGAVEVEERMCLRKLE